MNVSSTTADGRLWGNRLLRVVLAAPLLYVLYVTFHNLGSHWDWSFPAGQTPSFYLVTGALRSIPIAIWGLALLLLIVGTPNRVLWAVVCVGGCAIAAMVVLAFSTGGRGGAECRPADEPVRGLLAVRRAARPRAAAAVA